MTDLKVKKGDPIRASAWNKLVDRLPSDEFGSGVPFGGMSRVAVNVKNDSGTDRDIGEVLRVSSYDGPTEFRDIEDGISFVAVDPVWHTAIDRLVVLAEPIPNGERGIAVVSGLCVVKLTSSADEPYVMLDNATINEMTPTKSGIGRLLSIATSVSGIYGVVLLGDASSLWRYEMLENSLAPGTTTCKLVDLSGGQFSTDAQIELSDPDLLMDDQVTGNAGFCIHAANEFYAIQAVC